MGWKVLGAVQLSGIEGKAEDFKKYRDTIRPLFEKKRPSQPGDWLSQHQETGQTLEQYIASQPTRATKNRKTIIIQTIGTFPALQQKSLSILCEYMALLYNLSIRMEQPLPLSLIPPEATREIPSLGVKQLLTSHILHQVLKPRLPADAVAMLALTSTDLWPGDGWNFVFGQASLRDRVGVWSTARFGDPEKEAQTFLRRVLHVATHETGHIFGIKHCTAYECCMNGANHQIEGDRSPLAFCCECDAKLAWAANANTKDRAKKLADFMEKIQFPQESEHWKKLATLL